MPDRYIRAGILSSDRVNKLSFGAEVFYRRLMSIVDDYGRYDGRPAILRAQLYPLKLEIVTESNVGKWIRECVEASLVRGYAVSDRPYIELLGFNQRIRSPSKCPDPPPLSADCPQLVGSPPADVGQPQAVPTHSQSNSESDSEAEKAGLSAVGAREDPLGPLTIPPLLNDPTFLDHWETWRKIRVKKKRPVTGWKDYFQEQLDWLANLGLPAAIATVAEARRHQWMGLFERQPKPVTNGANQRSNQRAFSQTPDFRAIR